MFPDSLRVDSLLPQLGTIAQALPLPWFVFIASFIEEVISPIPSALVTTFAGSATQLAGRGYLSLFFLSILASLGKTLASLIYYVVADKSEDVVVKRYGKYFGIDHESIEAIGQRLRGQWRDDVTVFFLRAIPIAPTGIVSFFCGLIKIDLRSFFIATFLGFTVRSFLLLFLGFIGIDFLATVDSGGSARAVIIPLMTLAGSLLFFYLLRQQKSSSTHNTKHASKQEMKDSLGQESSKSE